MQRTTSMICIKVRPKLTTTGSDSLATGRSNVLYFSSKFVSNRFSLGPPQQPAK